MFQYSDNLLSLEDPDAQGVANRFIGRLKQPQFVLSQILSLSAHCANNTPQNFYGDLPIDPLTLWQEIVEDDPLASKEMINKSLTFDFVLLSLLLVKSETSTDFSGACGIQGRRTTTLTYKKYLPFFCFSLLPEMYVWVE